MSINWSSYAHLTIPEGKVKRITKKDDGTILWEMSYVNQVRLSIDESGAIYNRTGYKSGYRVRSGGVEAQTSDGSCTGYIAVKPGDTIRISGCQFMEYKTENAINVFNSSFTVLGQVVANYPNAGYGIFDDQGGYGHTHNFSTVVEETSGVWRWILPPEPTIAYIRVTGHTTDGSSLVVTINEEIK